MHCVTGWSTLDNVWTGVPFRVLAERAGVQPEAKWVIAHCEYGYTSDLSLEAMMDDDVLVAWAHHGETADARARVPAPPRGAEALRVEEREVAARPRVPAHNKRGFWEVRGYHIHAEPWAEERYSYQEGPRAEMEP